MSIKKKILPGFVMSIAVFHAAFPCGGCSVTSHCGYTISRGSNPITPGCETLEVIIHNDTQYELDVDKSYEPSTDTGNTSVFAKIDAGKQGDFLVKGVAVDNTQHQDEVDTSVRYIAKYKNKSTGNYENSGAAFVITLKKSSCNASSAENNMSDYRCYYDCRVICGEWLTECCWGGCAIGSAGYSNGRYCDVSCAGQTPDAVCKSYYDSFSSVSCHYASTTPLTSMSSGSLVTTVPGVYTIGAKNLDKNNYGTVEDTSVSYTTSSYFVCDKSSECSGSSDNDAGCSMGTSDHNKTAKLEFYVKPSPVEHLTVHFLSSSANTQTTVSHAILQSLYNNLNPEYLAQLGTYFSLTPVQINSDNKSITFSTLCNDASCKQVS